MSLAKWFEVTSVDSLRKSSVLLWAGAVGGLVLITSACSCGRVEATNVEATNSANEGDQAVGTSVLTAVKKYEEAPRLDLSNLPIPPSPPNPQASYVVEAQRKTFPHTIPRVRAGAISVSGRLSKEVIQRILRQNHGSLRLCYAIGLGKSRTSKGVLLFALSSIRTAPSAAWRTLAPACPIHRCS